MKISSEVMSKLKPIEIFLSKKKYESALEYIKSIEQQYPSIHLIHYYAGIAHLNLGNLDESKKNLEKLIKSDQLSIVQLIQVNMLLGLIYTDESELMQAEYYYKEALKINSKSSMCYSALGYIYYLNKRFDSAIQNFKTAIELDQNNASAHNNLGFTYADIGINLNIAIRETQLAVQLNPESAAYHDSLGWALCANNQYNEGIKELEKALKLAPENSVIKQHLNEALRKKDKR